MRAAGDDGEAFVGTARQRIGRRPAASSIQAPTPAAPANRRPSAGAKTTPSIGSPSSTSAMLTVNSSLRLMNSLVPSSGSTSQKMRPDPGHAAGGDLLLGDDRDLRRELAQAREDQRLRPLVGFGDRRRIVLAAGREVAAVDRHHQLAGALGDVPDMLQKLVLRRWHDPDPHRRGRSRQGASVGTPRARRRAPAGRYEALARRLHVKPHA